MGENVIVYRDSCSGSLVAVKYDAPFTCGGGTLEIVFCYLARRDADLPERAH